MIIRSNTKEFSFAIFQLEDDKKLLSTDLSSFESYLIQNLESNTYFFCFLSLADNLKPKLNEVQLAKAKHLPFAEHFVY